MPSRPTPPRRRLRRRAAAPLRVVLLLFLAAASTPGPGLVVRGQDASPCNICGSAAASSNGTLVVGDPNATLENPVSGTRVTCAELQGQADAGAFDVLQCTVIQSVVGASDACGCEPSGGGAAPTPPPAEKPAASPTSVPPPTQPAPSPSPSPQPPTAGGANASVASRLLVEFAGLATRMGGNLTAWYERTTCEFLEERASGQNATGLSCLVLDQTVEESGGNATNATNATLLGVLLRVVAEEAGQLASSEELSDQLAGSISSDPEAYLAALDRPFFENATGVQAFAVGGGGNGTDATASPTAAPSSGSALLDIEGRVSLIMQYVAGEMRDPYQASFENETSAFLASYLSVGRAPVVDLETAVLEQTVGEAVANEADGRQSAMDGKALTVLMAVTGKRIVPMDLAAAAADTLNENSAEYVLALRRSSSASLQIYTKSLQNVSAAAVQPIGTPAPAPSAPTATVAPAPSPAGGGSPLSGGAIAGIVVGALVFVAVVGVLGRRACAEKAEPPPRSPGRHSAVDLGPPPDTGYSAASPAEKRPSTLKKVPAPATAPATEAAPPPPPAKRPPPMQEDSESSVHESGNGRAPPGAGSSPRLLPTPKGDDRNSSGSFEYGLKDGIGPARREISMGALDPGSAAPRAAPAPGPADPEPTDGSFSSSVGGGTSISGGGTSLSGGGASGVTSAATTSTASEETRRYRRTVVAPAGKLGIIIDTTVDGPVVYKVNADSPLGGVVFPGDLIIQIDDVETRAMSANNITTLMVQTAGQKRTLTVLSDDPSR